MSSIYLSYKICWLIPLQLDQSWFYGLIKADKGLFNILELNLIGMMLEIGEDVIKSELPYINSLERGVDK